LNDNRIQQILDIEKKADAIRAAALKEAQMIPQQAELKAQALIDQSRKDTEEEVRRLLDTAKADKEGDQIISEAQAKIKHNELLAAQNMDRAISYVLSRVVGKE
jgi:vacuolar-type H+-ATPase subunit H